MREGGVKGRREGGRKGGRERWEGEEGEMEGGREGGRKGRREGGREEGRDGGRERWEGEEGEMEGGRREGGGREGRERVLQMQMNDIQVGPLYLTHTYTHTYIINTYTMERALYMHVCAHPFPHPTHPFPHPTDTPLPPPPYTHTCTQRHGLQGYFSGTPVRTRKQSSLSHT